MEVDHAPALELGDLREHHPHHGRRVLARQARSRREGAAYSGGERGPQRTGVGVEQHLTRVVVPGRVQGGGDRRISGRMPTAATVVGVTQPEQTCHVRSTVDGPERRRGERDEHSRMSGHRVGYVLAAA